MSFSVLAGGSVGDAPLTPIRQPSRGAGRDAGVASTSGGNKDRWSSSYVNFDIIPLCVKKEMLQAMDEKNCNAYRTTDWNRDVVDAHLFLGAGVVPTTKLRRPGCARFACSGVLLCQDVLVHITAPSIVWQSCLPRMPTAGAETAGPGNSSP